MFMFVLGNEWPLMMKNGAWVVNSSYTGFPVQWAEKQGSSGEDMSMVHNCFGLRLSICCRPRIPPRPGAAPLRASLHNIRRRLVQAAAMLAAQIAALRAQREGTPPRPTRRAAPADSSDDEGPPAVESGKRARSVAPTGSEHPTPDRPSGASTYMLDRMFGRAQSHMPPCPFRSISWWTRAVQNTLAPRFELLMPCLLRPLQICEPCCGMASATMAARALGVPHAGGSASDLKAHAREWAVRQNPGIQHMFASVESHAEEVSFCYKHGRMCRTGGDQRDDLLVCGSP